MSMEPKGNDMAGDELAFRIGDQVETAKGAKFWGEIIAFDNDGKSPGCTVLAIDPDFAGTKHVYPLKQLRARLSRSTSTESVKALTAIRAEAGHQLTQLTSNHPEYAPFERIRDIASIALRSLAK